MDILFLTKEANDGLIMHAVNEYMGKYILDLGVILIPLLRFPPISSSSLLLSSLRPLSH